MESLLKSGTSDTIEKGNRRQWFQKVCTYLEYANGYQTQCKQSFSRNLDAAVSMIQCQKLPSQGSQRVLFSLKILFFRVKSILVCFLMFWFNPLLSDLKISYKKYSDFIKIVMHANSFISCLMSLWLTGFLHVLHILSWNVLLVYFCVEMTFFLKISPSLNQIVCLVMNNEVIVHPAW